MASNIARWQVEYPGLFSVAEPNWLVANLRPLDSVSRADSRHPAIVGPLQPSSYLYRMFQAELLRPSGPPPLLAYLEASITRLLVLGMPNVHHRGDLRATDTVGFLGIALEFVAVDWMLSKLQSGSVAAIYNWDHATNGTTADVVIRSHGIVHLDVKTRVIVKVEARLEELREGWVECARMHGIHTHFKLDSISGLEELCSLDQELLFASIDSSIRADLQQGRLRSSWDSGPPGTGFVRPLLIVSPSDSARAIGSPSFGALMRSTERNLVASPQQISQTVGNIRTLVGFHFYSMFVDDLFLKMIGTGNPAECVQGVFNHPQVGNDIGALQAITFPEFLQGDPGILLVNGRASRPIHSDVLRELGSRVI